MSLLKILFSSLVFLILGLSVLSAQDLDIFARDLKNLREQAKTFPKKNADYVQTLIQEAKAKKLSEHPHWIKLLRYRKSIFGGWKSEADNERYFVSPKGRTNPEEELHATLIAFATDLPIDEDLFHPQCSYPERYQWLKKNLNFSSQLLPEVSCPIFDKWSKDLEADSLTLVFSSYYMQAPASMFGHTLLKLNQQKHKGSELLDYGINYAADPGDLDPVSYTVRGLIGGYPGKFALFPYYVKVLEYNDWESRDLWEYKLELKEEERKRAIRHLWELSRAEFDYFFLSENCAYHLLQFLEVSKEGLVLADKTSAIVPPSETIQLYLSVPGFVSEIKYRPSLYSQIRYRILEMSEEEKAIFWSLVDRDLSGIPEMGQDVRKGLIADTLLDVFRYRYPNRSKAPKEKVEKHGKFLLDRSKLEDDYILPSREPLSTRPEYSHPLGRAAVTAGTSNLGNFAEIRYRLAYHDLLNVTKGHAPNSELAFFDTTIRSYDGKKAELTSLSLIRVLSFSPYNRISKDISYFFDFGTDTALYQKDETTLRKSVGNLDVRAGYSFANEFSPTPFPWGVFSLLVGIKAQTSPIFVRDVRYGPNASLVYQKEWGSWKVLLSAVAQNYSVSQNFNTYYLETGIRYAITNQHELRLGVKGERYYEEVNFSYHILF